MLVLEQKLSILTQGPSRTRRNPALDVLTGRVADERVQLLQAHQVLVKPVAGAGGAPATGPTAMVLPVAAIRMAAVARAQRHAPSPWLRATDSEPQQLKLVAPPPSIWSRVPWLSVWLRRAIAANRSYRWMAHSPHARLAS